MGDLGLALEAMHAARHRFRAARAVYLERFDGALGTEAFNRFVHTAEGAAWGLDEEDLELEDWESYEWRRRLWLVQPDRLREEVETVGGRRSDDDLEVRIGNRWWTYNRDEGAYSNEDDPSVGRGVGEFARKMFEPSRLLGLLRFDKAEPAELAGRQAIVLHGTTRGGDDMRFMLELPARELELAVDAERGVLLRWAELLDGECYKEIAAEEIAFDEQIGSDVLKFDPPQGTRVQSAGVTFDEVELTLEEAAARVLFPVFSLDLSDEWRARAVFYAGDPGESEPEMLRVEYRIADASHRIALIQHSVDVPDEEAEAWELLEHNGEKLSVRREPPPMAAIELERGKTRLMLTSETLSFDRLLELVDLLVPVSS
jgi:hypothetical protein